MGDGEKLMLSFIGADLVTHIIDKIGKNVEEFTKKVEKNSSKMAANFIKGGQAATIAGTAMIGIAAAEGAAMLKLAENVAEAGHQQYVLSQAFGIGAEEAGLWSNAAEAAGVDSGSLGVGFKTLAKNMEALKLADTATATKALQKEQAVLATQQFKLNELKKVGNKQLIEQQKKIVATTQEHIKNIAVAVQNADANRALGQVFNQLGVEIEDTKGNLRPMNDVMFELANSLAKMPDGAEKAGLAVKLFGRNGLALLPLLDQGAAGIRAFMDEAKLSGEVLDDSQVKEAQAAYIANKQLHQAIGGITTQLAVAFLPLLIRLTDVLIPLLHNFANWVKTHEKLLSFLIPLGIALTAIVGVFITLGGIVAMIVGSFMAFGAIAAIAAPAMVAIGAAALPVILIIAALAAVALAVWFAITHWDQIKAVAAGVWASIQNMVGQVLGFFDSLIAGIVHVWTEFWTNPLYYVGLAVGFVITKAIQIHDTVLLWISKMVKAAITWWVQLPDNLIRIFAEMIVAVSSWADKAVPAMLKAATDLRTTLWNELKKLPGQVVSIGADIARGLVKGLTSIPGEIAKGAQSFTGGVLAGIKKAAGIKSPSTVFAESVGIPIAQGIAAGIKAGLPEATGALNALVLDSAGPHAAAHHATITHNPKSAAAPSGGMGGSKVEEILQKILDALLNGEGIATGGGTTNKGALSPSDVLAAFGHLVEAAQIQRQRGTRAGFVQ